MDISQIVGLVASFVRPNQVKEAVHGVRDLMRLYDYVSGFPTYLQAAWALAFVNVVLAYYDYQIGWASVRNVGNLTPEQVKPLRVFLRRALLLTSILFCCCIFGPGSFVAGLLFWTIHKRFYAHSGAIIIFLVTYYTVNLE